MSRTLVSFGLPLLWLVAACDFGGLDSHRVQSRASLIFTMQPTGGIAGLAGVGLRPVAVTVLDEDGNTVTSARTSITVRLGNNPGGGTLSGTVTIAAVNGVATFSDLRLDTSGIGYTLVAEATGLSRATSSPFKVTFAPAKLVFRVQPSSTAPGEAIAPAVQVAVLDVEGNTVESVSTSVTLTLRGTGAPLREVATAPAVNGVATFPNLSIDKPGRGYSLIASDSRAYLSGLNSITSAPFTVGGFAAISAGSYTCGLELAGAPYCWGGEFPPTPLAMAGGLTFAAVTVGSRTGCGVTAAGAAHCWGDGFSTTPVAVAGGLPFTAVSGSCGVLTTGAAYCWGDNDSGQLGDGSTVSSSTPVAVAGGLVFASVSAGASYNCGVTTTGAAYCWGDNYFGELGNGSFASSRVPVAVAGGLTFASVSAGPFHSCGVTTAGAAYCWGDNTYGQLGNGEYGLFDPWGYASSTPVAVAGGLIFERVSAGGEHSCGVTTTGATYCWGRNENGELGNGSTSTLESTPVAVAGGLTFATVSAAGLDPWGNGPSGYSCGVTTAGGAHCWGSNGHGELGNGSTTNSSTPVAVAGELVFASVSAGAGHNCGVTTAGEAYCWGDNYFGELGNGSTTNSNMPVAVAGGLTFASVSADAFRSSCGVTTAGAAYCWGFSHSRTPVALAGEITFATVSAGSGHSCGVSTAGVAYCWGYNDSGELGDGSTINSNTPVVVAGGLTFATVSAGNGHSCGVTTTGAAHCWGANAHGELGDDSTTSSSSPVAVAGGLTFATVSAGDEYSCGVTTSGAAYCWGSNDSGELGNSWMKNSSRPVAVTGDIVFTTISAGAGARSVPSVGIRRHSCGLTKTGAAYCWGSNYYGELGDGSWINSSTPLAVGGGLTFASVSAGSGHSCGLTTTGGAYCWGENSGGELGNGSNTYSTVPLRVPIP